MPLIELGEYWLTRLLFQRGLAIVYFVAFLSTLRQWRGLLGEDGILPVERFVNLVSWKDAPSLFHFEYSDRLATAFAGAGVFLAALAITGVSELFGAGFSVLVWGAMWILYLSFVNVGQVFYAYGWESILLETGFFAIFLGGFGVAAPDLIIWILRWVLFRVMFGAGLIKLRGDSCWRDLTCMFYHHETQPMPNPGSWFAHHLPNVVHKGSVLFNHIGELIIPFFYFAPQPFAMISGIVTIVFQALLMISGNFSWLNFLTIVLAFSTFDNAALAPVFGSAPAAGAIALPHQLAVYAITAFVIVASYYPVRNMLSPRQRMNASFNNLHLVNTYGAFGSITKKRFEIVIEGSSDGENWKAYRFKGKPGGLDKRPPQVAPYHFRLDWQMWFAAMTPRPRRRWFNNFLEKLLEGNEDVLKLLAENPFPDEPPQYVRAVRYRYEFTSPEERKETGNWWKREFVNMYVPPHSLEEMGGQLPQGLPALIR